MLVGILKKIKQRLFKKKKPKLKSNIKMTESNNILYIEGLLSNPNYTVIQLCFKNRETEIIHGINIEQPSNEFNFKLDMSNLISHLKLDGIYDLYLKVKLNKKNLTEKRIESLEKRTIENKVEILTDESGDIFYSYMIRLGRFQQTEVFDIAPKQIARKYVNLYKTIKGNISLAINHEIDQKRKMQIDQLISKGNELSFNGKLFTRNSEIETISLVLKARESTKESKFPVNVTLLKEDVKKKFGLNRYWYEVEIDLDKVFQNTSLNDDVYDLLFEMKLHDYGENVRMRIGNPRFRAKYRTKGSRAERGEKVFSISPYYTVKHFNLSIQVDSFDKDTYSYLRKMMRWAWLLRLFYRKKDIWVVGERPYKAQDTGYHFFKYMRNEHPEKETYYVIEEDSPELKNVAPLGNVLYYKSKKHIKYVLMARRVIGSHHPDYLYPLRSTDFIRKVKAKKVFLQHGVLGTKNTEHFYGKDSLTFSTDLFIVSSEREKGIVMNDFGYEPEEVAITGLSRFDRLFDDSIPEKRQLLIIPTWREWLVEESRFLDSEYFERYRELIFNENLQALSEAYNFEVVFCLHPNMQQYTHYFKDAPVRIINQGEVDVQDLLKESSIMITDYSSVAFDFSFLNKPIIYYQFDRKRFIGRRGSHLDLDNDLPGDIVSESEEIFPLLEKYAYSDFKMTNDNQEKAGKFLKYKDKNNSKRIYEAVSLKIKNKSLRERILATELYKTLFKRFRKSKRYFPAMRTYYNIARRVLPVDDKLILFESGIGKQFADSPKVIYQELLKRDLGYKVIWACNKKIHFRDLNTKRVKRLSPSYYYYLAKAKIWVNNQNFPTYIKKRPQTTYLQTWHGTPLKKMLYDLDKVYGRSDDYVERVGAAVENWDYLISPSNYATRAFRSAFKYEGEVLEVGYPRNDIFYLEEQDKRVEQIKKRLQLPTDKKIILYAPTFRDNQAKKKNKFTFDLNLDLEKMHEQLGDDYIFLLRTHVVVKNKFKVDEALSEFILNVTNYPDMQELLLIADIFMTDYSSAMFDYANTKRPLLFYTYDLDEYRDDVRGFYIDFESEAPGPLLFNTDEVIDNVLNIEAVQEKYKEKYNAFYDKYCHLDDGHAGERIVDYVFDKR